MIACDYSDARPSPDDLRGEGIGGVMRYLTDTGRPGDNKAMDLGEYEALLGAGFAVAVVMETFNQAASRGYDQGLREAQAAFAAADALGWPRGRPVYFVAEDPTPDGNWGAVADYFRAVHDFDPGRPRPGAYGSGALSSHLNDSGLASNEWHVSTWPGLDRSRAALVQEANGIPGHGDLGGSIDLDTARDGDWGQVPWDLADPWPVPLVIAAGVVG